MVVLQPMLNRILRSLLPSAWQLLLVAFVIPAQATYYMDDTNSSIVYSGANWSRITADIERWVGSREIYFATL
jgi:hypothetical protein